MVDLTKPCGKCGAVNRYRNGKCKPCKKASAAKYLQSDMGRAKQREYRQSDKYRAKDQKYRQSEQGRATTQKYRQSDEVRAKQRERQRKRRESATGCQEIYAARLKRKKILFEFSLQKQIKELTQCQQKSTQPNKIS